MHRRIASRILTLTIAAGLFTAVAACTVSTAEPNSGSSTKKDAGRSSSSNGASADEDETDSGQSTSDTTKSCSGETTAQSCEDCCGYNQQLDDIFAQAEETYIQCACTDKCKTACGSFCTDPQAEPSDACITCLDSDAVASECGPKADEGCNANAACKAFLACEQQSGCLDKPEPDAG